MAHLLQPSSWQRVLHFGCSQIGSHTWLQTGESHFHWHFGWQLSPSHGSFPQPVAGAGSAFPLAQTTKSAKMADAMTDFIFDVMCVKDNFPQLSCSSLK
jgi:hypothetical protein